MFRKTNWTNWSIQKPVEHSSKAHIITAEVPSSSKIRYWREKLRKWNWGENKQTNEGYRTTMRKVYLLPITPKEFLVVIWLNSEEWKAESTFQIISSIHKFIMKMQQILGSHYLPGHTHPKTNESTFIFLEFVPACKKSVHSVYFLDTVDFGF